MGSLSPCLLQSVLFFCVFFHRPHSLSQALHLFEQLQLIIYQNKLPLHFCHHSIPFINFVFPLSSSFKLYFFPTNFCMSLQPCFCKLHSMRVFNLFKLKKFFHVINPVYQLFRDFKLPLKVETSIFGFFPIFDIALNNLISPGSIWSYSSSSISSSSSSSLSSLSWCTSLLWISPYKVCNCLLRDLILSLGGLFLHHLCLYFYHSWQLLEAF